MYDDSVSKNVSVAPSREDLTEARRAVSRALALVGIEGCGINRQDLSQGHGGWCRSPGLRPSPPPLLDGPRPASTSGASARGASEYRRHGAVCSSITTWPGAGLCDRPCSTSTDREGGAAIRAAVGATYLGTAAIDTAEALDPRSRALIAPRRPG
jgi:hypothetical protein